MVSSGADRTAAPDSFADWSHADFGSSASRSPSNRSPTSAIFLPSRRGAIHRFSETRWFTRTRTSHSVHGVGPFHWSSRTWCTCRPNCSSARRYSSFTSGITAPLGSIGRIIETCPVPELPDVEHFRQAFRRHAAGKTVLSVTVDPTIVRNATVEALERALPGHRFDDPARRGKWL